MKKVYMLSPTASDENGKDMQRPTASHLKTQSRRLRYS
jgi:hypothetical protein